MSIISITRRVKKPGESVRHTHDTWEFILACEGVGTITVDKKVYPFKKGTVICVPPGTLHYNFSENNYVHIAILFNGFIVPDKIFDLSFQDDSDATFETLAKITLRMFYKNERADSEILNSLLNSMCALFFNNNSSENHNPEIEAVKCILSSNFTDPEFTVSNALENLNYSEAHFRKLFRKETNMTPVAYLNNLRLKYAKSLLENSDARYSKISYIALRSGFYDQRYFSRLFKRRYNLTPLEYRDLNSK